jgi:tetratricopeptide (TPR) repeat protein
MRPATVAIALLAAGQAACAAQPGQVISRPNDRPDVPARPARQEVLARVVVTPREAASVDELLDRASRRLQAGEAAEAARAFDRLFALDPDGPLAAQALLQSATAHERAGDREASARRLEQLAERFPRHALAREALVRTVRLRAFLEQWTRAGQAASLLLMRYADLRPFESVVALSGRALALVAAGDVDRALYYVEQARTVVEDHGLDAAGRLPRDLAQLYFALGEIRRIRAERIQFVPLPGDFPAELERRCQLLLDAQSAYSDTMRAYDAHWSAMAGYRVGQLYQKLHEELMRLPVPATADTPERRQLFEGAMRLRYAVLLSKALAMMEHTLAMAARTGERSEWVWRTEQAKRAIQRAMQAEQEAIDRLPYTREQLRAALDRLARQKAAAAGRMGE